MSTVTEMKNLHTLELPISRQGIKKEGEKELRQGNLRVFEMIPAIYAFQTEYPSLLQTYPQYQESEYLNTQEEACLVSHLQRCTTTATMEERTQEEDRYE